MRRSPGLKLQAAVVQDNVPTEVCAGVFIGSVHAGFNVEALKEKRVTHVLNLAGNYTTFPEDFTYLSVSVRDKEQSNLLSCLPIALMFIDGGVKVGGVLVHCSGGRSRSPAVVIAYLMAKKKLSFQDAHARVKALRPVMGLNAGFEEQLRCLEAAHGDVFVANQLLLEAKMRTLSHQLRSGELLHATAAHKKKALRHGSGKSFRHTSMPTGAFQLAFDERDMLCGKVPSGFCLSMPSPRAQKRCDLSGAISSDSSTSEFIPALRSMATVFGCRECGTGLFCASAILQHKAHGPGRSADGAEAEPLGGDQVHLNTDASVGGVVAGGVQPSVDVGTNATSVEAADSTKKKPLLAKLRLRPQSPSVSKTTSDSRGKSSKLDGDKGGSPFGPTARRNADGACSSTSSAATGRRPGLLQTVRGRLPPQQSKYDKENSDNVSPSSSRSASSEEMAPVQSSHIVTSPVTATTSVSSSHRTQALWRSIATLKAAKRHLRDAIDKRAATRTEPEAAGRGSKCVDGSSSKDCREVGDAAFLKDNARLWEQGIRQILQSGLARDAGDTATGRAVRELGALLDADAHALEAALEALGDCQSWFVEPQAWFLDSAAGAPTGQISCPNSDCESVVGEWHWDGARCSCNAWVQPAFAMDKERVRVLGVLTARSSPPLAAERAADLAVNKLSQTW